MTGEKKRALIIRVGNACEKAVHEFGLRLYPQRFDFVHDIDRWNALISHSVLENVFFNHHHGRDFAYLRSKQEFGGGMAIEVVTNENPCRGYLFMPTPTPLLFLSQAHALAHNNFFRVNRCLRHAHPDSISKKLAEDARMVARYRADPSIDRDEVTDFLDACRHIMWHKERGSRSDFLGEDLLRFFLSRGEVVGWKRDVAEAVLRFSDHLYAIRITRLANEGYASFLEAHILERAFELTDVARTLRAQCRKEHAALISPPRDIHAIASSPSPYWIGHAVWKHIAREIDALSDIERIAEDIDDDTIIDVFLTDEVIDILKRDIIDRAAEAGVDPGDLASDEGLRSHVRTHFGTSAIPRIVVCAIDARNFRNELILEHVIPEGIRGVELNVRYAQVCIEAMERHFWKNGTITLLSRKADGTKIRISRHGTMTVEDL